MDYPSKVLSQAVEQIATLPGIGHKTALRMALHLLRQPREQVHLLATALSELADNTHHCHICHNICDANTCDICADTSRKKDLICVVEDIRDVLAIEQTGLYRGVYHVLGGRISPVEGIGPSDIEIESLVDRVKNGDVSEIIFALSATIEGDTTAYYIYKMLPKGTVKLSSIARGVSVGGELQYTDNITLARSIQNRIPYDGSF
ncbi:MAG: recombination mediator RecR [Flavobacteriales bacterium]|nr:recombination mediator RecR [Flavobacteriales bacterium]